MKNYHLVISDRINISKRIKESSEGHAPRHFFIELTDKLNGLMYEPSENLKNNVKKDFIHILLNTPQRIIELADIVSDACDDGDVVFCNGEAIAIPVAYSLKRKRKSSKIASFGHNLYRPRILIANLLWGCLERVDRFLVFTKEAEARSTKNKHYFDQIDDRLFSCDSNIDKVNEKKINQQRRPIIVSVGLEKRDNLTLAKATLDLDVDVRITAYSRDARLDPRALPNPMPSNMNAKYYSWTDLVALYRSADLVIVPIVPTNYAAGITSILEAAAIGCPIIATANPALMGAVANLDIATWVEPENPQKMKAIIVDILNQPDKINLMRNNAKKIQNDYHRFEAKIEEVMAELVSL